MPKKLSKLKPVLIQNIKLLNKSFKDVDKTYNTQNKGLNYFSKVHLFAE